MLVKQFINSIYSSNTYIISNDKKQFWLIDCGDVEEIIDSIVKEGIIVGVFFTHTHYDHIYGINNLLRHFPRAKLFTNTFGKEALMSPKLNYSKYHQEATPIICNRPDNIFTLYEGDKVNLSNDISIEVFETLGHDKSCLCYRLLDGFFSGDSYIPNVKVYSNFLNGNKVEALQSLERIKKLCQGLTLYPGHGCIYPKKMMT